MLKPSRNGRVLTLLMDDPSGVNTISIELGRELVEKIDAASADPEVGAIVLTGAGKTFSAGANVKQMAFKSGKPAATERAPKLSPAERDEQVRQSLTSTTAAALRLADSPKPTIALVNGACAGGGLALAAACDIRLAAAGATFAFAYPQIGLGGDLGAAWWLSRILGPARARHFCLLAPRLDGAGAAEIGLVSAVYPDDQLAAEGAKLAARIAGLAPVALAHIKQNLDAAASLSRNEAVEVEAENFIRASNSADHREAARAFVEKRAPNFTGR